jgi:hypothetical protein
MATTNAFGQEIKQLCFTPEQDELLALGYPHLARIVDGHADDAKPEANARKAATKGPALFARQGVWPREVAHRFVRLARTDWFQDWQQRAPTAAELAVPIAGGPVSEDEARAILAFAVKQEGCIHPPRMTSVTFLLEQMVGTEVVVDAILDAMEKLPEARFRTEKSPDRQLGGYVWSVGFMLLRLPAARRAHHRARLEALWDAHHAGSKAFEVMVPLDRVLHGAAAFSAWSGACGYLDWYVFVDDVDRLREVIARKDTVYAGLDVRFVYLAGPEILGMLGKHRPASAQVGAWLDDIGMIQHPSTVSLFMEYVGKTSAKTKPIDWLRAHADFAGPIVEELAKRKGAEAEKARAVLTAMAR